MKRMFWVCAIAGFLVLIAVNGATGSQLIASGSMWKYNDNGVDLETTWLEDTYDDAGWTSGPAQLGYGDGDEATTISYGGNRKNKYPCYYFRYSFDITDPSVYGALTLKVIRDDGCIVYLNGQEIARSNMPSGGITYNTWASSGVNGSGENTWYEFSADVGLLVAGTNTIAVEVHQNSKRSSDLSFNLELIGHDGPGELQILKGPYLQMATPNSIVIMWETDLAADSRVDFGLAAPDELSFEDYSPVTIHEMTLTDLTPDTKYYYTVTSNNVTSATYTFSTAPETVRPFRFAAYGDIQRETSVHGEVVQGILGNTPEFVIHTGDMVNNGRDYDEWGPIFFNQAQDLICNTPFMPARGNHEYWGSGQVWFEDFFSLANNEEWYAYTYSNARFIVLNTNVDYTDTSDQYAWLTAELVSSEYTNAAWQFVYFHHPPFTSSRHTDDEGVKTHLVPLFDEYDVDMVFSGHSHLYERYFYNDVYYFVIGGGGQTLDPLYPDTEEPIWEEGESVYHYCVLDVSDNNCNFVAKRIDGSVIDQVQLTNVNDIEPPVITSSTGDVPDATTGDPISISANITDNIGVSSAKVYYTPLGGSETNITMTKAIDSDVWSGEVPVDLNNTGTIPYHVSAVDGANNPARDPASGDYSITVSDNDPPVADAGEDQTVDEDTDVHFDGSGSSDNIGIVSYKWDIDNSDGVDFADPDLTGQNPVLSGGYAEPGEYIVTLQIVDGAGYNATDVVTVTVTLHDGTQPSITSISGNKTVTTGENGNIVVTATDNVDPTLAKIFIDTDVTGVDLIENPVNTFTYTYTAPISSVAPHTYYVKVYDAANNFSTSAVYTITVIDNDLPIADAGQDQSVFTGELVSFNGSASSDNIGITSYSWDFDASDGIEEDATGVTADHTYSTAGQYTVTLTVTDGVNPTAQDNAIVTVTEEPTEVEVFSDSFEDGTWNGKWSEDSQNDWFRSTQRAVDGSYSAEVDGSASDAQLISVPIDLLGRTSATISFSWYIEKGLDTGEYLAFDVSTDGGSNWIEKARLQGNVDTENTWHSASVDLSGINSLKLRFRGKMNRSKEDADVDAVTVIAR